MQTNTKQIVDVVKSVGAILGTYIIAKGWIPVGVFNDIISGLILFITAGLAWKDNATPKLIKAVSDVEEFEKVIIVPKDEATPELKKSIAKNPKVEMAEAKFYLG